MSKGFASNPRQILLATLVLASFVGVGARLVWLHVLDRDALMRYVSQARYKIDPLPGRRGDILDANGAKLATSRSLIILAVDPQSLRKEDESKWPQLASLIGMNPSELVRIFNTKTRPAAGSNSTQNPESNGASAPKSAKFAFHVTPSDAFTAITSIDSEIENSDDQDEAPDAAGNRAIRYAKLSDSITETTFTAIKQLNIKGVIGQRVYRRAYPNNSIASHIIGYVDRAERPVTGIERYADFYLHGLNGWLESEKDGKREELAQFRTRQVPAADGYSVKLSIDSVVQQIVDEELAAIASKYAPEKATIIVSDPRTGFILALGNYPSFDLNTYNKLTKEEQGRMRNIALSDMYEPGSVFKIVAVAGALNEGLVNAGSTFDCTSDSIEYQGKTRKLPREDHHFDHRLTVAEIVAHSSNRGAAQLAMSMGDDRFYGYARAFGFGQLTGFPNLGIESPGMLASPKKWDGLTITRMPMGHSIAATPLQMHQAMTVIASGGVMLRPSIIREVLDSSGEVVYRFDRRQGDRVVSERTAQTVARMLQGVASKEGTAPEAAIKDYEVAGKTGTAQKIVNGRYSEREHVVSFVGFLPASQPRLVISVIVDGADKNCPGGVAYGAKVAAPSFKRVAEQLIRHLDIKSVVPLSPVAPSPKGPAPRLALKGSR
jgi:cell division protein FtsI/penicillin-binding protein 2